MQIKYEFVNETVEFDVEEKWANLVIEYNRQEYNNNRKETRRHNLLSSYSYENEVFMTEDENLNALFNDTGLVKRLHSAMQHLTDKQRAVIKAIYFDGIAATDYAKQIGVSKSAVSHQLESAKKKIRKYL